jgi:hypothetical protein
MAGGEVYYNYELDKKSMEDLRGARGFSKTTRTTRFIPVRLMLAVMKRRIGT